MGMDFSVIDVETANFDVSSICQVGIIVVRNGEIRVSKCFFIDPECAFDARNIALHGINEEMVAGEITFPRFHDFLVRSMHNEIFVSHGKFDARALAAASSRYRLGIPLLRWVDSVSLARVAWPSLPNHKLATLADEMQIAFRHHDALEDARVCHAIVMEGLSRTGSAILDWAGDQPMPIPSRSSSFPRAARFSPKVGAPLSGMSIVFTGEISVERTTAQRWAAEAGLKVRSSVSERTNFVVLGAPQRDGRLTQKEEAARELVAMGFDINLLNENEFRDLMERNGVSIVD